MDSNLLNRLRRETASLHETLDAGFVGNGFNDRTSYIAFLKMQARVLPEIENQLAQHLEFQSLDDWRGRLRTPALLEDLTALSIAPPRVLPYRIGFGPGHIAGVTYVLEGSRNGGRFISRKLLASGHAALPMRFINHGIEQRYWQSYKQWLLARDGDEAYQANAISAARSIFELFIRAAELHPVHV